MKTAIGLLVLACCASSIYPADSGHWVATWSTSPALPLADTAQLQASGLVLENQTIREIVHTSIGGSVIQVRLSNIFGKQTLEIAAAHVALRSKGSELVPGSDRILTFAGHAAVSIPPNAVIVSDSVKLDVPSAHDLAISLFIPRSTQGAGIHYSAQQTSYIDQGDLTAAPSIPEARTITSWVFLAGVDVRAPEPASAIVAFGDSITDGAQSSNDANRRWPNVLANRLLARGRPIAVVNAGIGGNRILHDAQAILAFGVNALSRFDRDALDQPGVKYVIVLEGINDLGHAGSSAPLSETVSAEDLIAAFQQLILRAHERGIKIFGATMTPFVGTVFPGYFSPEKEAKRKAINQWIRTSKAFDGVIDFDKAVQDPAHPDQVLPTYDSGDHLHPGDAGYKAMADSIDLSLFK